MKKESPHEKQRLCPDSGIRRREREANNRREQNSAGWPSRQDGTAIPETMIRKLAYKLYEERGRGDGHDLEDWLEAESMLRSKGEWAA
jgi:DUF2934 family protein